MECDMEYFRLITNMNYKAKNMFTELNICWTVYIIGPMHFNWFDASLHVGGGRCMLQFCGMLHGWLVAFVAKSESAWERKRERGDAEWQSGHSHHQEQHHYCSNCCCCCGCCCCRHFVTFYCCVVCTKLSRRRKRERRGGDHTWL